MQEKDSHESNRIESNKQEDKSMEAIKMGVGSGMKSFSTNWVLRDTKEILDFKRMPNPSLLGAGVFGSDDFYHRLCHFVVNLKRCYAEKLPKLYFASVDIRKCYGNIQIEYLLDEIMVGIMKEEEYLIRRHSIVHSLCGNDTLRRQILNEVDIPGNHKNFTPPPTDWLDDMLDRL